MGARNPVAAGQARDCQILTDSPPTGTHTDTNQHRHITRTQIRVPPHAHVGPPDDDARQAAVVDWLWLFDAATGQAAERAVAYCDDVATLQEGWRRDVGAVRANSCVDRLLRVLPGSPVLSVEGDKQVGSAGAEVGEAAVVAVEVAAPGAVALLLAPVVAVVVVAVLVLVGGGAVG